MLPKRKIKLRLAPYRVLTFLTYGNVDGINIVHEGVVEIKTGPLSRKLRTTYKELSKQIVWLESNCYLRVLERKRGSYMIQIMKPEMFSFKAGT